MVRSLWMVRVLVFVAPTPGARKAPVSLPVPTVTEPAIMPLPPESASVYLHVPGASRGATRVSDPKDAVTYDRPLGIGVGSAKSEHASAYFRQGTGTFDKTGEGRA